MKKRIMGILLSIGMLISMLPTPVLAAGSDESTAQNESVAPADETANEPADPSGDDAPADGSTDTEQETASAEAAEDADGDGYVEIDTAAKLWWFSQQVNGGNTALNAVLTADIDLSATCGEGIGNWQPIGNNYSGHFNGQGFTVSNLYVASDEQYAGLFGYVSGATIENVTVTGSVSSTFDFSWGSNYDVIQGTVGGVVAHLYGGTIRNCHVDMTVSGENFIGGICGYMDGNGLIENCTSRGSVVNPGQSKSTGEILGGIVSYLNDGTVRGCTNYATFSSLNYEYAYMGGITAFNYGTIESCVNFGNVISLEGCWDELGGIASRNVGTIRNCGNHGNISGYYVGGIVNKNIGAVENCYNVGTVSGTTSGPIAGTTHSTLGTATYCYYLSDATTEDGGRTAEQFASGQVAYELNGSTTTDASVWKQTLGTDNYPVLSGELVYYGETFNCGGESLGDLYSNNVPGSFKSTKNDTTQKGGVIFVKGLQKRYFWWRCDRI